MENPVKTVTSNLTVGKVIGFLTIGVVVFAALDYFGITNWLLFPVTTAKSKFGKTS